MVKTLDPEGIRTRKPGMIFRRVPKWFPGPNYMWSLDSYMKMEYVSIQIYECVDAFSRQLQWLYIGHSGKTQISVILQFLDHLQNIEYGPEILRTDFKKETPMLADAHYSLRMANNSHRDRQQSRLLPYRNHGADGNGVELRLEHCYYYGKSTRNLAVETWWNNFRKSKIEPWLVS